MSKTWFDRLDPDHQKLILQAWTDATDYANNMAMQFDAKLLKDLQTGGMTLIEPDVAAFRAKVQPVLEELSKTFWVPGLYERIIAIK
jgi:TRAP-type C4-dicarboxylate transport system substrate-binding protein